MDSAASRGFAICLRACDLIRELEQKIGETAADLRNEIVVVLLIMIGYLPGIACLDGRRGSAWIVGRKAMT